MKKIIAICAALVFMLTSICLFSGCKEEIFTEEQHIERIIEKLQKKYFNDDGTPTNQNNFNPSLGEWHSLDWWQNPPKVATSFIVEILPAFDGKREYFLIIFEPAYIGVLPGIIVSNNEYRILDWNMEYGYNPFKFNNIEKEDCYYTWYGSRPGFAAMIKGHITSLHDGHIYSEDEIRERSQFLKSKDGLRFMRGHSSQL